MTYYCHHLFSQRKYDHFPNKISQESPGVDPSCVAASAFEFPRPGRWGPGQAMNHPGNSRVSGEGWRSGSLLRSVA